MQSFEEVLRVGGKTNSLGRAGEVFEIVSHEPSRLDELFQCISADDAWVRMRAIDTFEKLIKENPQWVQPYLAELIETFTHSTQPSVQWHLAQIFSEVSLTEDERKKVIGWLKERIKTIDVDWIVAVNVMKTLLLFHTEGAVSATEIRSLFMVQEAHSSKTVRKKAVEFQQELIN